MATPAGCTGAPAFNSTSWGFNSITSGGSGGAKYWTITTTTPSHFFGRVESNVLPGDTDNSVNWWLGLYDTVGTYVGSTGTQYNTTRVRERNYEHATPWPAGTYCWEIYAYAGFSSGETHFSFHIAVKDTSTGVITPAHAQMASEFTNIATVSMDINAPSTISAGDIFTKQFVDSATWTAETQQVRVVSSMENTSIIFPKRKATIADNIQYHITGYVKRDGVAQADRTVFLFERDSGELMLRTKTNASGQYDFNTELIGTKRYFVVAFDDDGVPTLQAKIKDYLLPDQRTINIW